MAIEVTSWAEFLEAASGDDPTVEINLPENAEWDLGEIEPEGHDGAIKLCGIINGRGTKIKNLVVDAGSVGYVFYMQGTIYDLHFIDGVWRTSSYACIRLYGADSSAQLCTFSASVQRTGGNMYIFDTQGIGTTKTCLVYRCAFNLELSAATGATMFSWNTIGQYNNIKISGSRITSVTANMVNGTQNKGKSDYSYVILDTPAVTALSFPVFNSSLLRCTGANVTDLSNVSGNYISIACSSDFPNASQVAQTLALCTESQLHDAAYLQSIGFPIGV